MAYDFVGDHINGQHAGDGLGWAPPRGCAVEGNTCLYRSADRLPPMFPIMTGMGYAQIN
ncbi:MAG: hypothetical protein U5S82_14640 [Gammaproteobacteria bacterium]|nr:hypothetical protein [Gammaproteobacteria bacterium]